MPSNTQNAIYLRERRRKAGAIAIGTVLTCGCGATFIKTTGPKKRCAECQRKAEMAANHACLKARPEQLKRYRRKAKDNYYFGGNREKALERDGYKCCRCGSPDELHVHHKDGNGSTSPREERNDALDNLETLCKPCHTAEHHVLGDLTVDTAMAGLGR